MKERIFTRFLFLTITFFTFFQSWSQSENIEKWKNILRTASVDTVKISAMDELTWEYLYSDIDSARKYGNSALLMSEMSGNESWLAVCHQSLGTIFFQTSAFDSAIVHFELAKKINEKIGNKNRAASNFNGLGNVYLQKGMYKKSLDYYLQGAKLAEESGDQKKCAVILNNVALIYHNLGNYDKSLECHLKSLHIAEEFNDSVAISSSYTNIANLYNTIDSIDKSEEFHLKSLGITRRLNLISRTAQTYTNLALVCEEKNDFPAARKYLNEAIRLHKQMDNNDGIMAATITLGQLCLMERDFDTGIKYFLEVLEKSKELDVKERVMNIYENLHIAYSGKKDFFNAYKYLLLYSNINDTMLNTENSRQMAEMQTIYETDKKQKELALQSAKIEKQHAEINKQKIISYSFAAGVVLLLVVAYLILRSFLQKKRAHYEIEKRNLKLQRANEAISDQKKIIEEKNNDIIDSIRYAKRIQDTILPSDSLVKKLLPESFILYKPKDIVAGDFYWVHPFSKPPSENQAVSGSRSVLVAACDCTGHGVPGAFVSIVANNALKRAVNEFGLRKPSDILDKVNEMVVESFSNSEADVKDGMDIALVCIDFESTGDGSFRAVNLQYAGANNPIYFVKKKVEVADNVIEDATLLSFPYEICEIKANKQPIGKYARREPFTNNEFSLEKGNGVYLFSDGYADQFGGSKGKKFKYKQLQNLLMELYDRPMPDQKEILNDTIEKWRGDLAQIDDICIIGIKP